MSDPGDQERPSPMEEVLREGLPAWLDADLRLALLGSAGDPIGASIAVGRVLRVGRVRREVRTRLEGWIDDWAIGANAEVIGLSVESDLAIVSSLLHDFVLRSDAARAAIEHGFPADEGADAPGEEPAPEPLSETWVWDLLAARDDVESRLITLGRAAIAHPDDVAVAWERRLVDAAVRLDRAGRALAGELAAALRSSPASPRSAWLEEIAGVDNGWWTEPIRALAAGAVLAGWSWPPDKPSPERKPIVWIPALAWRGDAVVQVHRMATGDLEWALAQPRRHPIARLFDGRVELFAIGAGAGADPAEPIGVIIAEIEDQITRVTSVALEPPLATSPSRDVDAGAWWVPLTGSGSVRRTLVATYQREPGAEPTRETIEIDPRDRG